MLIELDNLLHVLMWFPLIYTYIDWYVDIPCVRLVLLVFQMTCATIILFCFMICECENEDFIGVWNDNYLHWHYWTFPFSSRLFPNQIHPSSSTSIKPIPPSLPKSLHRTFRFQCDEDSVRFGSHHNRLFHCSIATPKS
jgi:hypothetical protein